MQDAIDAVRGFNRFYTRHVGALSARFLDTDLSLAEARLLFEIANRETPVAADLQSALGLDAGYVSRMLRRFESRGLLSRETGAGDRRKRPIVLTVRGRALFDEIDRRQRDKVADVLKPLGPLQRTDLIAALGATRAILDGTPRRAFDIRAFRPGDLGLIASRQSILYRRTYGWGPQIEIIEGEVTTAFLRDFKPGREQCWIAEIDGAMAGSIFLTDEGNGLCRLRLLYVEPFAHGRGIGKALVASCIGFAREVGFARMTLWTHTILDVARRIYAAQGFQLVETKVHDDFGIPLQGETWSLDLAEDQARPSPSAQSAAMPSR